MAKILVVEDVKDIRDTIVDHLELYGHDVLTAENGAHAMHTLESSARPDLVLCDIEMPEVNGYAFLKHVRNTPQLSDLPFIFLTAYGDRNHQREGMGLGADDYIVKPFSHEEIITAVDTRLRRKLIHEEETMHEVKDSVLDSCHTLSHELQTPVATMMQALNLMDTKLEDLSDEDKVHLIGILRDGGRKLKRAVEQIILQHRIETGQIDEQYVQQFGFPSTLHDSLQKALRDAQEQSSRNNLVDQRIIADSESTSHIVPQLITLAIFEVLLNAYLYSDPSTTITVKYHNTPSYLVIDIADDGYGIPRDDLYKITLPNYQIAHKNTRQQGVGLGLTLAKAIVECHGGRLRIQSTQGSGTSAQIILPASK